MLHASDNTGRWDLELEGTASITSSDGLARPDKPAKDGITVTIAPRKDGTDGRYVLPIRPADGEDSEGSGNVAWPHLFQNATSTLPGILLTFVTFSNQT